MAEGQELCARQNSAAGIKLLRQAFELDENNSLARAVLANALVEQAHSIVESDWREAEKLAREALDLNPGHPMAKTIRLLILDQKRETFVEECVSQARKQQAAADLTGALSRIDEGLSTYPREPRLIQIQEAVQRDLHTQRRHARRRELEELRRMESEIDVATDAASKQALGERVRAVAEKYSKDGEILSIANGFLHRLGLLEVAQRNPQGIARHRQCDFDLQHSACPRPGVCFGRDQRPRLARDAASTAWIRCHFRGQAVCKSAQSRVSVLTSISAIDIYASQAARELSAGLCDSRAGSGATV